MKIKLIRIAAGFCLNLLLSGLASAANPSATVRVNAGIAYQKVTGFGGFVNSPTFQYNHMSADEIRKMWGKNSEMGYNIMRLYIPIGEANWSQSLATAQLAKSLGIKLFASPWSMPAEWKTYNTVNAVYTDANNVKQLNYLKEAYYANYANYLNNYVTYLRNNGVELDAISIQNEPDMDATYAGCIWTPAQIAGFVKNYGHLINCKVIAPEGVGVTDNYANAFADDAVCANYEIFAGHQYGAIQSAYKNLQAKGKEVWMTEYLINWNADESTTRDFVWSKDAFTFASKLNTAMLGNINAWIHYATKRYYGLMGDGFNGSTSGVVTKRGYILSHFAKYATGATRIDNSWKDDTNLLQGSSYLSATGDSVIVMVINPSASAYDLTVDIPFYSTTGYCVKTTEQVNMAGSAIGLLAETCRPKVTIDASSFTTLIFKKSSERPVSQMVGTAVHCNKIDDQAVTSSLFGTKYRLSGTTATFDHGNSLVSANTTASNGYLKLDDRYNQLVLHVNSLTSTLSYTSANTTLYYINNSGLVSSHNYGTVNFSQNGDFDWVIDLSRSVLADGCKGVLGIGNGNWSSVLTMTFGDVYFKMGSEKMYQFTGPYSKGDSNLLDCLESPSYTSLNFAGTTGITGDQDWQASSANKNCLFYVAANVANSNANVVAGTNCDQLTLSDDGGNFYAPLGFSATTASYTRTFTGYGMMVLPFAATIPSGVNVYTVEPSSTQIICTLITSDLVPANTPVLVQGTGRFTFMGNGTVSTPHNVMVNDVVGVYISVAAPASTYCLNTVNGVTAFYRVNSGAEPVVKPFGAYLEPGFATVASSLPLKFVGTTAVDPITTDRRDEGAIYDLWGRRVVNPQKGVVYIRGGKKVIYND